MAKSRRQFLNRASLALMASAAACRRAAQTSAVPPPGAPPAFGTAPPVGPEVSPATFAEAEKLVQAGLSPAWTSFSASAKVAGETSGPTGGAVPKAGGAPGGGTAEVWAARRHAAAEAINAREARLRNCLRDFAMSHIVARWGRQSCLRPE